MWIFDIEIYQNLFLVVFKKGLELKIFEISPRKQDTKELANFIAVNSKEYFIGFNSERFDIPMLERFLKLYHSKKYNSKQIVMELYRYKESIFNSNKWFTNTLKTIDLRLVHHLDNKNKMVSLKELAFTLRIPNISSLPYPPNTILTNDQIQEVLEYCIDTDITTTEKLAEISVDDISMRIEIGQKYNLNCMSWNAPKIGEEIFKSVLISKSINVNRKTFREQIVISEILFDIKFNSEEFQSIYKFFTNRVITSTNKVFSELPLEEVECLEPYIQKRIVKKKFQENLNIVYKGLEYVFGVGGIHGCIDSGIYRACEQYMILDIDVSSFYPNLAKVNRLYPKHLNEIFCDIYAELYEERQKYPKKSVINKALKLALNGVYGKSNSDYSIFKDAAYTMSITINGQLLICKLAEMITEVIDTAIILQANTDGLTVKLLREDYDKIMSICKEWEEYTKLQLEYNEYSAMYIRDVNNYLAVDTKGDVKRKGVFKFVFKKEMEIWEDFSFLVVAKALSAYFLDGIQPEVFVREHKDIYDFFGRVKLKGDSTLICSSDEVVIECEKVTRYLVTKTGGTLIKTTESGRTQTIEKGFLVSICNNIMDMATINNGNGWHIDMEYYQDNIDYDYYIAEVRKVIDAITKSF